VSSLFRPEAVEGQQQGWLGSIQLIRPVSLALLTGFVVVVAIGVASYLSIGEYTRKARVIGYLVPDSGVVRLSAQRAATVAESHVTEGQVVKRGDVLFVLSLERATAQGDTQAAVKASLAAREQSLKDASRQQVQLQQSQASALQRQIDGMRQELAQMAGETDLQKQRLALAQQTLARWQSLEAQNFVSSAQVQTKSEEVFGLKAQLQGLERQRTAHLRDIGTLEAQLRELPMKALAQQGGIERDLAELSQQAAENEAQRGLIVRAPQDGVVTAVLAVPGQATLPTTALASLVPANAKLQAHLYAPSSAVGFVRSQQEVLLRYAAYPYQKFGHQGGHVMQVSRTPLPASELSGLSLPERDAQEPMYRITVSLDAQSVLAYGQAQPLSPGMQLEADVLLDRRRLIEWIFEPVLSIAGKV
jgi:membrane fusion protein